MTRNEGPRRRIRRQRLVGPHDPGYLAFLSAQRLKNRHLGPKHEPTAMQRLSVALEEAGRAWLGDRLALTSQRVLSYEIQQGAYGYGSAYREIDAVAGSPESPEVFFEIKVSSNPRVIGKAWGQLRESLEVASHAWPRLRACILYIDMGCDPVQAGEVDPKKVMFITDVAERHAVVEKRTPCLVLLAGELWALATRWASPPQDSLWVEAQREVEENRAQRCERERLRGAGVPQAEWPVELREQRGRKEGEASFGVGNASGESVLASALRRALGSSSGTRRMD